MAISHVDAITAGATSLTPPAHAIGDIIVIFAFRDGSATAPSLGAGYTTIATKAGTSCSHRIGYKIATSTSDASGTWSNASSLTCVVLRSSVYAIGGSLFIGSGFASSAGTTNTLTFPTVTMDHADSTSYVAGFIGHRSVDQAISTHPPSGMTLITNSELTNATCEVCAFDTNGTVNSWTSTNVSVTGTASGWTSETIEIIENQPGSALAHIVQHVSFAYTNTNATGELCDKFVFPVDPTFAGNTIVFAFTYPSGLTPALSDDKGNTWPAVDVLADPGAGNSALAVYHLNNAITGTSLIKLNFGGNPCASVKAWVTQLCYVTGTLESTSAWKAVGVAPTVPGIISPGSQTPSVDNCLILSYLAFSNNNVTTNPALIVPETGYNLNDADISWGANGIPNASQYALQGTKAATVPKFYLNAGGTTDTYNVVSIALSTGVQGTPKPSGPLAAPWIDRILHFGTNNSVASWLLQVPSTGNAMVCRSFLSDTGTPHLTSVADNDSGSWTLNQPFGAGAIYIPSRVNITSPRSNRTMTVGISGTGQNLQWIVADISNCDPNPVVATAGTNTNSTANTTIADQPDITPTAFNQLTLAYQQLGVGPYWGVTVPSGAVLELPFASTWQGTAHISGTTLTIDSTTWGAIFTGSPILSDAGSHVAPGTTLASGAGPYTLSASQGTVSTETMNLSTSDTDTINWGNGSAHYFNAASKAQQAWTWGIAQQGGGGGGFSAALTLKGPSAGKPVEVLQAVKRASYI